MSIDRRSVLWQSKHARKGIEPGSQPHGQDGRPWSPPLGLRRESVPAEHEVDCLAVQNHPGASDDIQHVNPSRDLGQTEFGADGGCGDPIESTSDIGLTLILFFL